MSHDTIRSAGILFVILPTVAYGGASILFLWITTRSGYMKNRLRSRLWAAGHAHAGVLLVLSLVSYAYLDAAGLSPGLRALASSLIPAAAILVPAGFFLSVLERDAQRPSPLINLAYLGFLSLTAGLLIVGIGLL